MASWWCPMCGTKNAGEANECRKCATERPTEKEIRLLEQLRPQISQLYERIDAFQSSVAPKWDYLQLNSRELAGMGGLGTLGDHGWELVAVSTYVEGETVASVGIYDVNALYVFKRLRSPLPETLQQQLGDIEEQIPPRLRRVIKNIKSSPWKS